MFSGLTSNDVNYPVTIASTSFDTADSSKFNLTSGSLPAFPQDTAVTASSTTGANDVSGDFYVETECYIPAEAFTSPVSYYTNTTIAITLMKNTTTNQTFQLPCPNNVTDADPSVSMSVSSEYSWVTYDLSNSLLSLTSPSNNGTEWVNYAVPFTGLSGTTENLAITLYISVYE
jgi:hypothetical protein